MNVNDVRAAAAFPLQPSKSGKVGGGEGRREGLATAPDTSPAPGSSPEGSPVTQQELEFFASLYPESAAQIRSSPSYQRAGVREPAILGAMIDRKV